MKMLLICKDAEPDCSTCDNLRNALFSLTAQCFTRDGTRLLVPQAQTNNIQISNES